MAEEDPIPVPVSDVAEWDDDARLDRYPADWPFSGRSEDEVLEAAKKLKQSGEERLPDD